MKTLLSEFIYLTLITIKRVNISLPHYFYKFAVLLKNNCNKFILFLKYTYQKNIFNN